MFREIIDDKMAVSTAQKLLDFGQKLDVTLLDQVI